MKRLIITEEEKKEIRKKYGLDEDIDLTYPPFNQRDDEEEEVPIKREEESDEYQELDYEETTKLRKEFRKIISRILKEFGIKKRGQFLTIDFERVRSGYRIYLNKKFLIDIWNSEIHNLIDNEDVENRIREVFEMGTEKYKL
jgi:hypothetical protein